MVFRRWLLKIILIDFADDECKESKKRDDKDNKKNNLKRSYKMEKIKELIKQAGGLSKVAKAIETYPQQLYKWINRNSYPTIYVRRLAKALKITEDELLELIEEEAKKRGKFQ